MPLSASWADYFRRHTDQFEEFQRYTMEADSFCRKTLKQFQRTQDDAQFKPIDRNTFETLGNESWSESLVQAFDDYAQFAQWGTGYVQVKDGEIIGGVSSYVPYEDGYEIEIDVHPDHQGEGRGKSLASHFILECLKKDETPYWDAHTEISRNLALKLGYEVKEAYKAYIPIEQ